MKHILRVPTNEPYAYIEAEFEGEPNEAVEAYLELTEAVKGGPGIGMKAFAKVIHEYCTTGAIVDGGNLEFSDKEKALLGEIRKIVRSKK